MLSINLFLAAYLIIYFIISSIDIVVDIVNTRHLKNNAKEIPPEFSGMIDEEKLREMNEYTIDNSGLGLIRTITGKCLFLIIILSGVLPWIAGQIHGYHYILAGLIFLAAPGAASAIVDLPFDYYHHFRIEEKYGFNTMTIKTWVLDLFKSIIITIILGSILLSLLLLMLKKAGPAWWIWAWIIFFGFQILISILYPTVIAPIFNKFTPIEDDDLADAIKKMAEKEELNVKGIFQMDAGKRSRHTNAYFSGLGKSKRIVLYDTLLESHDKDEILAVLAHEIGHLKNRHIIKQMVLMGIVSLILFFIASLMIKWSMMYESFGFSSMPVYVGIFLIAIIWEPVGFFLSPVFMYISRRYEREADGYVHKILKEVRPIIEALKKMARDNLSNLRPHPLYAFMNYSHPPILERIRELKKIGNS